MWGVAGGGGGSFPGMVENRCILFPPSACSITMFADTTGKCEGCCGCEGELGLNDTALLLWPQLSDPKKCRPSPQCEVLLCCHRRQSPAGAGERRCGGRQGPSVLRGCSLLSGSRQRSV